MKTKNNKHTPGPWVMDIEKQTTGHWYYKIVTEEKPLGNYPLHICTLNKFKDETHLKNANLIAAAPEMLEALMKIYTKLCSEQFQYLQNDFENELSNIEKAIQKARGD